MIMLIVSLICAIAFLILGIIGFVTLLIYLADVAESQTAREETQALRVVTVCVLILYLGVLVKAVPWVFMFFMIGVKI